MIKKEITLCGKTVTIGYCYATEIAYNELSGEDMTDYVQHAIERINDKRDPDIKRTLYAIIAAVISYADSIGKEPLVKDSDLMREAKPIEIGAAVLELLQLRAQFYKLPAGEPKEDDGDTKKKD